MRAEVRRFPAISSRTTALDTRGTPGMYTRNGECSRCLQTAEAFEKAEAQKWAQREPNQRQRRLLLVERLIEAVETMLKVPLTEVIWCDNGRCRRS